MKTEIIYDGDVLSNRMTALKNLAELVSDVNMDNEIRELEKRIIDRDALISKLTKSRVFKDVCICDVFYDWLAVGKYGIAVGKTSRPPKLRGAHVCENAEEVNELKSPLFGSVKKYEELVVNNIVNPKVSDVIGKEYELDFDKFCKSDLWTQLQYARDMEAQTLGVQPHVLFKQHDAFDYIRRFPNDIDTSSPIDVDMQRKILVGWKYFLQRKREW